MTANCLTFLLPPAVVGEGFPHGGTGALVGDLPPIANEVLLHLNNRGSTLRQNQNPPNTYCSVQRVVL